MSFDEVGLDLPDGDYVEVTSALARRHSGWGKGILLGDPDLVAAQLPKAARLRLIPLYGRPQVEVLVRERGADPSRTRARVRPSVRRPRLLRACAVGPRPAGTRSGAAVRRRTRAGRAPPEPRPDAARPDDGQLAAWADEGCVLVTLLLWAGMIRELDCVPRLIDLVAETELHAGLLVTAETFEYGAGFSLELLASSPGRGGVLGLLEPLLASTGRAVGAEQLLPAGTLQASLADARSAVALSLPAELMPRGWWPLLDTELVPSRAGPIGWSAGRPVIRFTPRGAETAGPAAGEPPASGRDLRRACRLCGEEARARLVVRAATPVRSCYSGRFRPQHCRRGPGCRLLVHVVEGGVRIPRVLHRDGDFVALSLTAGNWDGWSPFYTLSSAADLAQAERKLLRAAKPGWLVGTIDSPLWALPGEILERGSGLYSIARLAAAGGKSGRLVNVTPNVVARYARLLDERRLLSDREWSRNP